MLAYLAVRNSFKLHNIDRVFIIAEGNRTIIPSNVSVGNEELRTGKPNYVYIILMLHVSAFLESHHQTM
jgi:hypothetical protein